MHIDCVSGDVGGLYPSAIQAVLPRLLLAAAPPGNSALENRRQCLKVCMSCLYIYVCHKPCMQELLELKYVHYLVGSEAVARKKDSSRTDDPSPYS